MTPLPKRYLGDGVYVESGCYVGEFILTSEDGLQVQSRIVIDPEIFEALIRFREDTRAHVKRELAKQDTAEVPNG